MKPPDLDAELRAQGAQRNWLSRRFFLRSGLLTLGGLWTGACSQPDPKTPLAYELGEPGAVLGVALAPTPACSSGSAVPTLTEIEGPYYTPSTPRRASLIEAMTGGRRLRLVGRVVDTQCQPIPGAVLDFWQADAGGNYDNEGYLLRGHQFADADGIYALETVVPAEYSDGWVLRTPHLHVKVQGESTPVLTTQLYLPEHVEQNRRDRYYHDQLLMWETGASDNDAMALRFDFVLERSGTAKAVSPGASG